ncbi:MAG: MFS transporter [Janthinobacterium lividum]
MKQSLGKSKILMTVIFMDLLSGMEVDLFVPSFPELQSQFDLSSFWLEALLSINFIGFCLSLFLIGSLADHYGRKPILLIGMVIFIIGTLMSLSGSYAFLLMGRFFQGVGVAAPSILSFLIIADTYPLKKQQYLMAMLNGLMNISVGLAPVIGSYVTLYFHWQGNSIVLLLLALITLVMILVFIPNYKLPKLKEPFSLQAYIPLFQSKSLMLLVMTLIFVFLPYWIFVGMSPLLYMKDLGVSLAHFGYYQGAMALVFALGSLLYGSVIDKYDQKKC